MRRLLAAAVLVAFMPTAHAQDKAKGDFTHNAEYRIRDTYMKNESAGAENKRNTSNDIQHRFKLGLGFKANEKLSAQLTMLATATMGQGQNDTVGQHEDSAYIHEMYANWMMTDDMNLKVGRMEYQMGDGSFMGINDWEANPNAFEGALATYEMDFGKLQAFAFKYREYLDNGNQTSATLDPERNAYGLSFDVKTLPEMIKAANIHVVKDISDTVDNNNTGGTAGGATVQSPDGQNLLRWGAHVGAEMANVSLKGWYEAYTGKNKYESFAAGANNLPLVEHDAKANMMQIEVGYSMPSMMESRFHFTWHKSTGDASSTDNTDGTYDAYFFEQHENAGLMDLFNWGNLNYMQLGWMGKPMDNTTVGLTYTMFKRNEGTTAPVAGVYGDKLNTALTSSTTQSTDDKLGNEIDLWAEHKYDNGLSMIARVGYFTVGDAYKNSTPNLDGNITQVMLQGKMSF